MPRRKRVISGTGIYHVMLRGINHQVIFEDDEDCEKMVHILSEVKAVSKCKLLAYCLMQNHCHFLIKVEEEGLDVIFKRIGSRYVYWYNLKYKRTGHLFQDRFKSEVIENEGYLIAVMRYIHQNPLKAGLCKEMSKYSWSSYNEYIGKQKIVDTEFINEIIGSNNFEKLNRSESNENILEYKQSVLRLTDSEAREKIHIISGCNDTAEFQQMDTGKIKKCLRIFKESGMSIRQINRLTGISKGIVERS